MGKIWMPGGGGGVDLDVVTAASGDVLADKVIVGADGEPLTGTMTNRGAVNTELEINGTYTIPDGYHNGSGKVTQSIPTFGAQTITPSTSTQTVSTSGKYGNGNITVNAIPSNYYDINNNQVVFSYGSYGPAGALGAYQSKVPDANPWVPLHNPPQAAEIVSNSKFDGLYVGLVKNGVVFRGALPGEFRYILVRAGYFSGSSEAGIYIVAVKPRAGIIHKKRISVTHTEDSGILDLSTYDVPQYYWLCFYGSASHSGVNAIVTYIEVSRNPF